MSLDKMINKFNTNTVALKSEVVELANLKSLNSIIAGGNAEFDKASESNVKLKAILQDVKTGYRQAAIKYNDALKEAELIVAQVKELGIDVPNEVSSRMSWLKDNIKQATAKMASLQSAEKSL